MFLFTIVDRLEALVTSEKRRHRVLNGIWILESTWLVDSGCTREASVISLGAMDTRTIVSIISTRDVRFYTRDVSPERRFSCRTRPSRLHHMTYHVIYHIYHVIYHVISQFLPMANVVDDVR